MIALLCAMLAQELGVEILEKSPEVRILVRMKTADPDAVVTVQRRVAMGRDGALSEAWAEVSTGLVEAGRAEVVLPQPGTYRVSVGAASVQVQISRLNLRAWKKDFDQLQESVRRLEKAADFIDQAGSPTPSQTVQVRRSLALEREQLRRNRPEFHAVLRMLEEGVDRLTTFRTLVKLVERPESEKGYDGRPIERKETPETAREELKGLREVLTREAALLLLDELALFLSPAPQEVRILRWRDRGEAIEALRNAIDELGGFPGISAILKDAREGGEVETLRPRVEQERATLLRISPPEPRR